MSIQIPHHVSEDLMEDTLNVDLLRQTEGTTILHISFAVMEQRELRQEFLKYLKVSCGCVCGQRILLQNESFSVWDRSSSSTWGSVVAVCGQQILLHNHWNTWRSVVTVFVVSEYCFLTEAGIPQVREGQLWLCLWSKHAVAGPFSVMEQQELGQEFLQWLNLVCGQCMRLQKNPLLWWRSGTRVPQVYVGLLMLC